MTRALASWVRDGAVFRRVLDINGMKLVQCYSDDQCRWYNVPDNYSVVTTWMHASIPHRRIRSVDGVSQVQFFHAHASSWVPCTNMQHAEEPDVSAPPDRKVEDVVSRLEMLIGGMTNAIADLRAKA